VGHIPAHYSKKPFAARFPYIFSDNKPTYAFGHGLSYTTFTYSNPKLGKTMMRVIDETVASVDVTNTGSREADEVVQMYLHGEISLVTRPIRELKGFARVRLQPGETKRVEFPINKETLAIWNLEMEYRVAPGVYDIYFGGSSAATTKVTLTVSP
jgi:beta-glucosidase